MFYTIYKTTNKINGKIYIGKHQTKNLGDNYIGSGKRLWNSINKYGIENFSKEILFIFDNEEEMNEKEAELVSEEFVKEVTNYNLCPGGKGGWGYINTNGIAVKKLKELKETNEEWNKNNSKLISEGLKKYFTKNPGNFTQKNHTHEHRKKLSDIMKIKQSLDKNSQFGKKWITNGIIEKKSNSYDVPCFGWSDGRLLDKNVLIKKSEKEKEKKLIKDKKSIEIKNELYPLYEAYISGGFEIVKSMGYKYSQTNLCLQFKKYIPEFKSNKGKRRNKNYCPVV